MESVNNILSAEKLSFTYGKTLVLDDVNAQFTKGKFYVILGKNGSGKSTFFNVLAGLEKKHQGVIKLNGQIKSAKKQSDELPRIGFLTQFHQVTFPFSVFEVILTGRASFYRFAPSKEDKQYVEDILQKFDLLSIKDKPYTSLSGGQRQLVLLCRILVQQVDILLLDEPTNHLDLHYQVKVLALLKELAQKGTTVISVMHDPNLAFLYADCFYVMHQKKLCALPTNDAHTVKEVLEKTYELKLDAIDYKDKTLYTPAI